MFFIPQKLQKNNKISNLHNSVYIYIFFFSFSTEALCLVICERPFSLLRRLDGERQTRCKDPAFLPFKF